MDAPGQMLDPDRFTVKAKRWLVGAAIGIWLLLLFVVIPETWKLLDRAEMLGAPAISGTPSASAGDAAYTKLYTAAYLGSISPAVVSVVIYLLWRTRHALEERFPTLLLLSLVGLATCQAASVTAAWGDQYTGAAIYEELESAGISLWGRDAIERGWYVGYAALVAGAAVLSFSFSRQPRHQMSWVLGLMPFAVGVPWMLLAGPYL
ncbi:hypothetical protein HRW23_23525 [Streptomyces lunaelactis]|uniref:hypothetical protein n=1 Tax=Streptomyces lunaelactis TaxID=1535768 RepID=UPI001584F919|nr:hypothetical protein [Streptomyces lunaelactis]NUK09562.1 hypothetical protein [Streptomyces lunaelactis]NUK26938.1 hypothetical protein [Streptomyces lunaelactis]NUK35686.1 hypothetical protein [Streptomyces lunaelactis]NUK45214.1 hypothetical protein [Streptomyces lunaelactis]NUK48823.1 hypothetical protein [Streptomyces lunaelactis]